MDIPPAVTCKGKAVDVDRVETLNKTSPVPVAFTDSPRAKPLVLFAAPKDQFHVWVFAALAREFGPVAAVIADKTGVPGHPVQFVIVRLVIVPFVAVIFPTTGEPVNTGTPLEVVEGFPKTVLGATVLCEKVKDGTVFGLLTETENNGLRLPEVTDVTVPVPPPPPLPPGQVAL